MAKSITEFPNIGRKYSLILLRKGARTSSMEIRLKIYNKIESIEELFLVKT